MDKKPREMIYGKAARRAILRGLAAVEKAVGTTLGSKGRNVSIAQNWGPPKVLHDGVSVAREVVLPNRFENSAAQQVILAAQLTNNIAGDGTTTATILTYAIYVEAYEMLTAGSNPMTMKKGMEKAVAAALAELKKIATPVKSPEEMMQVATISSADKDLGKMIAETIRKVGQSGIVTVAEGTGTTIDVEYKEGMEFGEGWLNPYMVTNGDRMEAELTKSKSPVAKDYPYIIIINDKVSNEQITQLLNVVYSAQPKARVLVIADDFAPLAVRTLLINKISYDNLMVGVKSPEHGPHRTNVLTDIATAVGAVVLGGDGLAIENATIDHIGRAERILVTRNQTIIAGGFGNKEKIKERIAGLQKEMKDARNEFEKNKYEERLAKLQGGVAVINVGAPSETEMLDKKERIYDAVNATKAAVDEGIVPGGGVALVRAAAAIEALTLPADEAIGASIIKEALSYPLKKLITNSGAEKPDFVLGKIRENTNKNFGYNVDTEQYENLIKTGVVDPLKVTRTALEKAASVAMMLITTEVLIVELEEKPKERPVDDEGIGSFGD